jgi:hypothetical protein
VTVVPALGGRGRLGLCVPGRGTTSVAGGVHRHVDGPDRGDRRCGRDRCRRVDREAGRRDGTEEDGGGADDVGSRHGNDGVPTVSCVEELTSTPPKVTDGTSVKLVPVIVEQEGEAGDQGGLVYPWQPPPSSSLR